jgi:hypothetical protein
METFIATLRHDRESRNGPGVYASDKVFALLAELDRLRSIELNWQIDTLGGVIDGQSVEKLPCDVMVAPRTIIRKGCPISTLMQAISRRDGWPERTTEIVDAAGPAPAYAWIIGRGDGKRWRTWASGSPEWTDAREEATRFARREDAEAVHREDEDAWIVIPYKAQAL